ncbi:MAG: DUF87 domain-containing protein [Nitrosopumilaceae archaeon]
MQIGTDANTGEPFTIDVREFLKTHTFIQAVTGSGKTALNLLLVEMTESPSFRSRYGTIQKIIFDDCGEYLNLPKHYHGFELLQNQGAWDGKFDVNNASFLGEEFRKKEDSVVIKLTDLKTQKEREQFVAKFLEGYRVLDRSHWHPAILFFDEADLYVPTANKRRNCSSRDPIIAACMRARKENIIVILSTQSASSVHIDARRNCLNRFVGETVEFCDRKVASELLGEKTLFEKLWGLKPGQFFVRGKALSATARFIQTTKPNIETPEVGVSQHPVTFASNISFSDPDASNSRDKQST